MGSDAITLVSYVGGRGLDVKASPLYRIGPFLLFETEIQSPKVIRQDMK